MNKDNLNLQIGSYYTFTTIDSGNFPLVYNSVMYAGKVSYEVALTLGLNAGLWPSVYPAMIRDGLNNYPNDPTAYSYHVFKVFSQSTSSTGAQVVQKNNVVMASPWINPNSIKLVQSIQLTVNLYNLPSLDDVTNIISLLNAAGYNTITTNVTNPPPV